MDAGFATSMYWPTLALMLVILGSGPKVDRRDMVEVNHVCDCDGHIKFTQIIAWEWLPDYAVYRAQDWRIIDGWHDTSGVISAWKDGTLWRVRAKLFRETWTDIDVEMQDRKFFPEQKRAKVFYP